MDVKHVDSGILALIDPAAFAYQVLARNGVAAPRTVREDKPTTPRVAVSMPVPASAR